MADVPRVDPTLDLAATEIAARPGDARDEPTEALTDGPPTADFEIRSRVAGQVAETVDAEPGPTEAFTPSDLARPRRQPRRNWPTIAGYEILGELGRGGMGVVSKAKQLGLDRLVALKMVLAGAHASPEQMERIDAEARAVARLKHPNIVQIDAIGEKDGLPYFSLEYLEGGTLGQKLNETSARGSGKPRRFRSSARTSWVPPRTRWRT